MPKHTQVLKSLIHFECFVSSFSQRSQASQASEKENKFHY